MTPTGERVAFNFLLPSGTTLEDVQVEVKPGGRILLVTVTVPDFFLDAERLGFETNDRVGDFRDESIAHQQGVRQLRAHVGARVVVPMEYTIPIQVEEQLSADDINYMAFPHPSRNYENQYICYLTVHLRGFNTGYNSARSPAQIRVLGRNRDATMGGTGENRPAGAANPNAAARPDSDPVAAAAPRSYFRNLFGANGANH